MAAAITTIISIVNKLLDKTPSYSQTKREQWYLLQRLYNEEVKKMYPDRDDDLVMNLREQVITFAGAFDKDIN